LESHENGSLAIDKLLFNLACKILNSTNFEINLSSTSNFDLPPELLAVGIKLLNVVDYTVIVRN
jgi:hypothetical protein